MSHIIYESYIYDSYKMSHIYDQLTARDVLFERMIILYRAWRKVDSFLDQRVLEYV